LYGIRDDNRDEEYEDFDEEWYDDDI